jgi:DNA-directed RNA polymerase specialized sigma24 family protein
MSPITQKTQFTSWMREYAFIGVRIARAFEFEREAQADLLQEIFLQWWRSIPNLRRADNPKPWLYSVSLNVAITWQRQEARRGRVIDRAAPFAQLVENVAQPVDSIDRMRSTNCTAQFNNCVPQNARSSFCISTAFPTKKSLPPSESPRTQSAAASRVPAPTWAKY